MSPSRRKWVFTTNVNAVNDVFMALPFCIGACGEHAEHFLAAAMSSWFYVSKVNMSTSEHIFADRV